MMSAMILLTACSTAPQVDNNTIKASVEPTAAVSEKEQLKLFDTQELDKLTIDYAIGIHPDQESPAPKLDENSNIIFLSKTKGNQGNQKVKIKRV